MPLKLHVALKAVKTYIRYTVNKLKILKFKLVNLFYRLFNI